mmetsp:Transcript_8491/g.11130  ORF Transcript_8491/g.11130 Transcript_8491/m.11130 type:complete len:430 (-) Transcript_8491:219-1508(-)
MRRNYLLFASCLALFWSSSLCVGSATVRQEITLESKLKKNPNLQLQPNSVSKKIGIGYSDSNKFPDKLGSQTISRQDRINNLISSIPTPFLGLALGCSSLGKCWKLMLDALEIHESMIDVAEGLCELFALLILAAFFVKKFMYEDAFEKEVQSVDAHALLCAGAMSLSSISSFFRDYFPEACQSTWYMSVSLHMLLAAQHFVKRVAHFKNHLKSPKIGGDSYLNEIYPSIFLPTVGLSLVAMTSPGFGNGAHALGVVIFWYSVLQWLVFHPMVFYRMFFVEKIEKAKLPSFFMFNAPCAMLLCTYFAVGAHIKGFAYSLFTMQLLSMGAFVVFYLKNNMKSLPYSPAFASCTAPAAVTATAFTVFAIQMGKSAPLLLLAQCFLGIATAVVGYVTVRNVHWLWKKHFKSYDNSHLKIEFQSKHEKMKLYI